MVTRSGREDAMRRDGLVLTDRRETTTVHPDVVSDVSRLSTPPTLVVVCVKSFDLPDVADLLGGLPADVPVLIAQNGVPYWFAAHLLGSDDSVLESVDPGGRLMASLGTDRVVSCVVQAGVHLERAGHVRHLGGRRLTIGGPMRDSPATSVAEQVLSRGPFEVVVASDIASRIWAKLSANGPMNPLAAVTGLTLSGLTEHPGSRGIGEAGITEMLELGTVLGLDPHTTVAEQITNAQRAGSHKASMLQDVEARRRIEVEALVDAPLELARRVGVDMPVLTALRALLQHVTSSAVDLAV